MEIEDFHPLNLAYETQPLSIVHRKIYESLNGFIDLVQQAQDFSICGNQ